MVDHIRIANDYVQELLESRTDVVGALLFGSVARGDADPLSDIDMQVVVEGDDDEWRARGIVDASREGVYLDVLLGSSGSWCNTAKVLGESFAAAQVYDGLIVYDPRGELTRVQEEVRAVYMQPQRVARRVRPGLRQGRQLVAGFRGAVAAGDRLRACPPLRSMLFGLPSIVLIIRGITPSPAKSLMQLETVAPELRDRFCQWQGSPSLDERDVQALPATYSRCLDVGEAQARAEFGDLPWHLLDRVAWMVDNGIVDDTVRLAWIAVCDLGRYVLTTDDAQLATDGELLVRDWFRTVGWEGQEVLEEKVRMAEGLVAEVEAMAAHLPPDEG